MTNFPDLKFLADTKSLDVYAQAISQGALQLMNASNRTADEFISLQQYTIKNVDYFIELINKIKLEIA